MLGDFFKLVLPAFFVPKDYGDVLKRLAGFALWEVYIICLFLRTIPLVGALARSVENSPALKDAIATIPHASTIKVLGIAVAVVAAGASYVFQIHDRISDILKIRENFDINEILIPLAQRLGIELSQEQRVELFRQRNSIMHAVFYKYASSRSDKPLVDKHDIEHALGAWSWFWVFVEGSAYLLGAWLVALWTRGYGLAHWFFLASVFAMLFAALQYRRLPRYAHAQVETIANDYNAGIEIRKTFDALQNSGGNLS